MAEVNSEKITLQCVREKGKLRIRFHSYTNTAGKTYTNVYNNDYNCQFPKDIRVEGRFFEIGKDDIVLVAGNGKQPFYRVKKNNIRIVQTGPQGGELHTNPALLKGKKDQITPTLNRQAVVVRPEIIYEVTECVICLENIPDQIFIPCAHMCTCSGCYAQMKIAKPACPLCRRHVISAIDK